MVTHHGEDQDCGRSVLAQFAPIHDGQREANERTDSRRGEGMILESERIQEVTVSEREQFGVETPVERVCLEFGGARVGTLVGFALDGEALIDLPDSQIFRQVPARSCTSLASHDVGKKAVLLFEGGDPSRPIIVGLVRQPGEGGPMRHAEVPTPVSPQEIEVDDRHIELTAKATITLRCGDASITLSRDGRIVIRGKHVVSHAAGVNRIRGGSVQIN